MMNFRQIFRSLLRDRLNTSVIIVSLAVGIGCINLIILFLSREFNTDRFQKNVNRIFLIKCDNPFDKGNLITVCPKGAAEHMKENYAQIEDYCRVRKLNIEKTIANNQSFYDKPVLYEATGNFFKFFSFKLLTNNPNTVLETDADIAISDVLAEKYFGETLPVGKMITLIRGNTKHTCTIKGVFKKPEQNTQLSFDMVKFSGKTEKYAFLILKENTDPEDLEKILEREKAKIPVPFGDKRIQYHLRSLNNSYFDTRQDSPIGKTRDITDLWVALVIGLMIMAVASFNYIGLLNNRLAGKVPELRIRNLNGGSKFRLIVEFMAENLLVLLIAFGLSLELTSWLMPLFNGLTDSVLSFQDFLQFDNLLITLGIILILLFVVFIFSYARIAGHPLIVSQNLWMNSKGKTIQIPVFNILQIVITLILLDSSLVILKQIKYINAKDIGLDKEVIEVKIPFQFADPSISSADKALLFKEEILKHPPVANASITMASPLLEYMVGLFNYTEDGSEKEYSPSIFKCDENFIPTLGIKLLDGRNFSGNPSSDTSNCIINESMAKMFAEKNLIGTPLPGHNKLTVIGIVKNFNYLSLKNEIDPCIMIYDNSGPHLLVKPLPGKAKALREAITSEWKKLLPDYFVNIESVGDRFEWYHRENSNYAKLIGSCCLISLFLAMIGLFAVSYNATRNRTKEIGIRKINGASIPEVLALLNKDFIKWVITAFLIASPVAWYAMNKWLQSYAYKTVLSWWIFALAGSVALGIALLTVSWQSWRAATRNPVEALRHE